MSQAWLEASPAQLIEGINSDDPTLQLPAVTQFRKLLSIPKTPPITEVIAAGVVPRFVQFLQFADNPMLQFEAASALTNIAFGTSEHARAVISNGAVPILVQLLTSPNDDVREQAVWALGNIAGDSPECRDLVLSHQALAPLLEQLNPQSKISMLRRGTWTLSNLCRGKPQPAWHMVAPALPVLAQLISSDDEEVLADACWALSYLCDGSNEEDQAVLEIMFKIMPGIFTRILELMGHQSVKVQTPARRLADAARRLADNLGTGDDHQTQCVINCCRRRRATMKVAPVPQAMEREAKQGPGAASGGPKPLVQSQEEAVAFGERVWAQYLKDNEGKPPDSEIYFKPEKMYSLLRQGSDGSPAPVRLLRLSWLLKQARRGAVLPRRQELPDEAFLSEAEVRALPRGHVGEPLETCGCARTDNWRADKPLRIIAISYGWLTPEHPDPDGEQLRRFAKQIERERRCCPGGCFDVSCYLFCNALCLGFAAGYCCFVIPVFGQQCGDTMQQLPSGEFGVFYE